jgi:hypothetical protein
MLKFIGFACTFILLLPLARSKRVEEFSKYKSVETYEIHPGILMMPRYSDSGQVCEIAIEKSHYSPATIDLDPTLPREVFIRIVDELVPLNQRGRLAIDFNDEYMSQYSGNSVTTFKEYENISINIYGKASAKGGVSDVAATISWKNRQCRPVARP